MKKIVLFVINLIFSSMIFAETISFSADSMTGSTGSKNTSTRLIGRASITTESIAIKADSIELYGDNFRFITALGSVSGINNENNMEFTCEKLKYDRETKLITLENDVHLTDNDIEADAQLIEYNQKEDIAILQINVNLKQKDNICTASYAIYRKQQQTLDMSGNPQVIQGKDSFKAQEITLNLETQEITLDGRVRGSITSEAEEPPSDTDSIDKSEQDQNDISEQ